LFEYHNNYFSVFLIENSKKNDKNLKFNDDGSENCLFSQNINEDMQVKSNKKKIALFVQPKNINRNWKIRLNFTD
jgi:hypothetical protein